MNGWKHPSRKPKLDWLDVALEIANGLLLLVAFCLIGAVIYGAMPD